MPVSLSCIHGIFVMHTCYIFMWYVITLQNTLALIPQAKYSAAPLHQRNTFVGSNLYFTRLPPNLHFLSLDPLLIISCYIFIKIWKIVIKNNRNILKFVIVLTVNIITVTFLEQRWLFVDIRKTLLWFPWTYRRNHEFH